VTDAHVRLFRQRLQTWFRAAKRDLPWRRDRSLYKTVVSEIMLQQTQVKTVIPYLARWLETFPDFAALAAAPETLVLKRWEGLGYYSRARNLHALAKKIAALPAPPRAPEDWRELPGVGPYTAAAITSLSFGAPDACVDGNVIRILARVTADATPFPNAAAAIKKLAPLARRLLPAKNPGAHNEAMMELGALVCSKHTPLCPRCPVRALCAAARSGLAENLPDIARPGMRRQTRELLWAVKNGKLLLRQIPADAARLAGLHELPSADVPGLPAAGGPPLATQRRALTRHAITENVREIPPRALPRRLPPRHFWVPLGKLGAITLSGPHRRLVTRLLQTSTSNP
jgi:A/G-specific adenine glycosylase